VRFLSSHKELREHYFTHLGALVKRVPGKGVRSRAVSSRYILATSSAMSLPSVILPTAAALTLGICLLLGAPVLAQQAPSGGLPTAPAADRASQGGLSQAPASLPGGPNGASPLEPYLVTWLLPISGLISVFIGIYADRRIRDPYRRLGAGRPEPARRASSERAPRIPR